MGLCLQEFKRLGGCNFYMTVMEFRDSVYLLIIKPVENLLVIGKMIDLDFLFGTTSDKGV